MQIDVKKLRKLFIIFIICDYGFDKEKKLKNHLSIPLEQISNQNVF
jgi:hypothetical protein